MELEDKDLELAFLRVQYISNCTLVIRCNTQLGTSRIFNSNQHLTSYKAIFSPTASVT